MSIPKILGVLATLAIIAVSAAMNFEFAYGLGTTPRSSMIYGVGSVAADLLKAVLPILIASALAARAFGQAAIGTFIFACCLLLAFAASVGFGAENRGSKAGTREGLNATLASVQGDLSTFEARRKGLRPHRPLQEAEAALTAALAGPVMEGTRLRGTLAAISRDCTRIDVTTKDGCDRVGELRQEVAAAAEAARLDARIQSLKSEERTLIQSGAGQDADPQATAITRIVGKMVGGIDAAFVRSGLSFLLALVVEAVSAFGLYACGVRHAAPQKSSRRDPDRADIQPEPRDMRPAPMMHAMQPASVGAAAVRQAPPMRAIESQVDPRPVLDVDAYCVARIQWEDGNGISFEAAFADYCGEAARKDMAAMAREPFRAAFDELVAKIEVVPVNGVYRGLVISTAIEASST